MAKFTKGKKGQEFAGTKTAFRNFRKSMARLSDDGNGNLLFMKPPYAVAFTAWDNRNRPTV